MSWSWSRRWAISRSVLATWALSPSIFIACEASSISWAARSASRAASLFCRADCSTAYLPWTRAAVLRAIWSCGSRSATVRLSPAIFSDSVSASACRRDASASVSPSVSRASARARSLAARASSAAAASPRSAALSSASASAAVGLGEEARVEAVGVGS